MSCENFLSMQFISSMLGVLSLRLICDFLIIHCDMEDKSRQEVVTKCFDVLKDTTSIESLKNLVDGSSKEQWEVKREKCPYCQVDIFLSDINPAKCSNGHNYIRCCLTLHALKLRTYRVCIGCERKVSEKNLTGYLDVHSVLLNIDICPFCGCRLVEYQT